jgi:hypothetical protein
MTNSFDPSRYQDPLTIQRVLNSAKTIAIVGLSKNPLRASYFVGFYLRRHGYRVIPVNPRESEIFGEKSFNSLVEVPVSVESRLNTPAMRDECTGSASTPSGSRPCVAVFSSANMVGTT